MSSQPLAGDARARPSRIPTFRAPTKASLARSNPEILDHSQNKSPARDENRSDPQKQADTRVFGLRDRKAFRPSLNSIASPVSSLRQSGDARSPFSNRRTSGLQAFAAPPRRVSRKITPADFTFGSPITTQKDAADAAHINTPEDQLASELGSATGEFNVDIQLDQPSLQEDLDEPDLPPTPTQLGLEKPPERPRGLLSSSPSTQHGRYGKRRTGDLFEQSPSKLRRVEYGSQEDDQVEWSVVVSKPQLSEPVLKKHKLKQDLSTDLEKLREDIVELESWSVNLEQELEGTQPADAGLDKLLSLLVTEDASQKNSTKRSAADPSLSSLISTLLPFSTRAIPSKTESPMPTNPFALGESARLKPYLSVFASLSMIAHSHTISDPKSDIILERHHLTFSAPSPFPSTNYNVPVIYETNAESQAVTSISVPVVFGGLSAKIPIPLRRWIDSRLSNPLLMLDVSGLCQGINQYWEAMVSRAFIWSCIEECHADLITGHGSVINISVHEGNFRTRNDNLGLGATTVNASNLPRVLPHLKRNVMLFENTEKQVHLLLSCNLDLDEWTSEPRLLPDVSISAISKGHNASSKKLEQEVKKLFHGILKDFKRHQGEGEGDAEVIIRAAECVLGALFGGEAKGKALKTVQ